MGSHAPDCECCSCSDDRLNMERKAANYGLVSDNPSDAGKIKVITYRKELWDKFTEEDKERCYAYWRRMYSTDYVHMVVMTEPDEADMLFEDSKTDIVYQENMRRKPEEDFATNYVSRYIGDDGHLNNWFERQVLFLLLCKLFKGSATDQIASINVPGVGLIAFDIREVEGMFDKLPNGRPVQLNRADQARRIITYARS